MTTTTPNKAPGREIVNSSKTGSLARVNLHKRGMHLENIKKKINTIHIAGDVVVETSRTGTNRVQIQMFKCCFYSTE
jgi:hypothetical protein